MYRVKKQYSQTKFALGGDVTLTLVTDQNQGDVDELIRKLWLSIYLFEKQFSRFIPSSELSTFNRSAGIKQQISPEFKYILETAKNLSQQTGGLFNPFILPALQRAGYKKSMAKGYENDPVEDYSRHKVVDAKLLKIGDNWAEIPYGTAIDLGGCGKGYLADLLADTMVPDWVQGYWFSIGGDVAGQGYDQKGQPWIIEVDQGDTSSKYRIHTSGERWAAATSGTTIRQGTKNGKNWHHIIDPLTLQPSQTDLRMASVYTNRTVTADVLASCAIILGSNKAQVFLKEQAVKGFVLRGEINDKQILRKFGQDIKRKESDKLDKVVQHA